MRNIIKVESLERDHIFRIVLESTTESVVGMLESTFCPGVHLFYRNNKRRERELTAELSGIYGRACREIKGSLISSKDYGDIEEKLHSCLLKYMMYSEDGYTEGPVRSILGHHLRVMREVYRRLVKAEMD